MRRGIGMAVAIGVLAGGMILPGRGAAPATAAPAQKDCVTCLGPLDNLLPPDYFPLGGFLKAREVLKINNKPLLLFMATASPGDGASGAERWPLVKALASFGKWSGVKPAAQTCGTGQFGTNCDVPTFDLSRARFTSKYLSFREVDLMDAKGTVLVDRLSRDDLALYKKYIQIKIYKKESQDIATNISGGVTNPNDPATGVYNDGKQLALRRVPMVHIGDRIQTISALMTPGDLSVGVTDPNQGPNGTITTNVQNLRFDQIHQMVVSNSVPKSTTTMAYPQTLPYHVSAETNLLQAMICRATGLKPKSVCGRSAVKTILKHMNKKKKKK